MGPGLMGSALRPSEQEQMEQAIRAELWKVLDTSDLENITSKEVGRERARAQEGAEAGWGWGASIWRPEVSSLGSLST